MPNLKEFNKKLKVLKNTEKMARTMKMISASKLRRIHQAQLNAKFYTQQFKEIIANLSSVVDISLHPWLRPRALSGKILMVIFTSDRGLCGGFNNNLLRGVLAWTKEKKNSDEKIDLSLCGKRGYMFFKNLLPVTKYYEGITEKPNYSQAGKIALDLAQGFESGQYDEIFLAYNSFQGILLQRPCFEKILPIPLKELMTGITGVRFTRDYILEPSAEELLDLFLPKYLHVKIYHTLLENSIGEHAARMTAMDSASRNAEELIDKYLLLRNRARQAAITKELIEIISGAEALRN